MSPQTLSTIPSKTISQTRFGGINLVNDGWLADPLSEICSLVAYVLLILYFVWATKVRK